MSSLSRYYLVAASAAILLSMGAGAVAQQYKVKSIVIDHPWMRATPGGAKVAGGYMTITNTGSEPDRLVGGKIPQAGRFMVHEMKMDKGVMQMREVKGGLEIKPGQKVELKPGSYHLMFMDLHEPIKQGAMLKGELRFEKAGPVNVEYHVEGVGAQGPGKHEEPMHNMQHMH